MRFANFLLLIAVALLLSGCTLNEPALKESAARKNFSRGDASNCSMILSRLDSIKSASFDYETYVSGAHLYNATGQVEYGDGNYVTKLHLRREASLYSDEIDACEDGVAITYYLNASYITKDRQMNARVDWKCDEPLKNRFLDKVSSKLDYCQVSNVSYGNLDGVDAVKLEFVSPDNVSLWVDEEALLPLRIEWQGGLPPEWPQTNYVAFRNWSIDDPAATTADFSEKYPEARFYCASSERTICFPQIICCGESG